MAFYNVWNQRTRTLEYNGVYIEEELPDSFCSVKYFTKASYRYRVLNQIQNYFAMTSNRKKTKRPFVLALLLYFLWLASVLLYGFATFGSGFQYDLIDSNIIAQVTKNATDVFKIDLGYYGACVTLPSVHYVSTQNAFDNTVDVLAIRNTNNSLDEDSASSKSNQTRACLWPFNSNESPEKLLELFQDKANSTEFQDTASKQHLLELFEISTQLRSKFFKNDELTATFCLLFVGGLLFLLPLTLNSRARARRFAMITLLAALLTAFSLLTAGAGVLTLCRGQTLLSKSETFTLRHGANTFRFQSGKALKNFLIAAMTTHGLFALGVGLTLLLRQGGVSGPAEKHGMELPTYAAPPGSTGNYQHLGQGHHMGGHTGQERSHGPHRPRRARQGFGKLKWGKYRHKTR